MSAIKTTQEYKHRAAKCEIAAERSWIKTTREALKREAEGWRKLAAVSNKEGTDTATRR